jgi:N-methylhydantoinase A
MRIGIDTGGTFTNCVILEDSLVRIVKAFSTPGDAARAILNRTRQLTGFLPQSSVEMVHGTTLGTNSLLEQRGARVARVTTAGFEEAPRGSILKIEIPGRRRAGENKSQESKDEC